MYTDPNSTLVVKWYFPTFSHTQNQIYDILVKYLGVQKMFKGIEEKKKCINRNTTLWNESTEKAFSWKYQKSLASLNAGIKQPLVGTESWFLSRYKSVFTFEVGVA